MFKKLSKLEKYLLKLRDREAYNNYKFILRLQSAPIPNFAVPAGNDIHFKHSGHTGDIIYSLPTMYALAENKNIHLHLHTHQNSNNKKLTHPLGSLMLTEKIVDLLKPLLLHQPAIKTCDVYYEQTVHYDLDVFRQYPFNYKIGHIARWYFLAFGINADLGKPWLQAPADVSMNNTIIIARSQRYRNAAIDYSFLRKYQRLVFVGLEQEYTDMKMMLPNIEYRVVKDFLELSSLIAGCRFFIGNQSFPFSLAEGLKVKRLLEVYPQSPNVIVEGANGYDFCYQPQFEKLVADLYEKTAN
jgi:hypothetical protein